MINIDNSYSLTNSFLNNKVTTASGGASFAEILALQDTNNQEKTASSSTSGSLLTKQNIWQTNAIVEHEEEPIEETATDKFIAEMKKDPMERLREQVMKSLGITDEDLASMSPEERRAAEAKIAQIIQEKLEEGTGNDKNNSEETASTAKSVDTASIVSNETIGSLDSSDDKSDKTRNMEFAFVENLFQNQMNNLEKHNDEELA